MNVVLWIMQGVLAAIMLMAGGMKLPGKEKLLENPRMGWAHDYSDAIVRLIGALEILAAVGLILPWALDAAPVLTPLAALGVVAVQLGALATHRRRGENEMLPLNSSIAAVALFVAIGRFVDL